MEHFNHIILIASFLFPLTLSAALIYESGLTTSRRIMALTLFGTGILFFCNYLYFEEEYGLYYYLHGFHAALELWIFPAIYIYIKSIVFPLDRMKNNYRHFIPGAVMLLLASYIFYGYTAKTDLIYFLKNNRTGMHFTEFKFTVLIVSRYIHLVLVAAQGIIYFVAFSRAPKHFNERLENEFSNIENFSIDWIRNYLLSFVFIVTFGFGVYAIFPLKGFHTPFIIFVFFIFSAFVCRMGLVSMKQQMVMVDLDEIDTNEMLAVAKEKIVDTALLRKLKNYMEKKQAFLQPDLTLSSLAGELATNRTYLSALINQEYGVNFNSYVNQYRVKYINAYLKEHPDTSYHDLVQIGGFGSVSTMKRALKNMG